MASRKRPDSRKGKKLWRPARKAGRIVLLCFAVFFITAVYFLYDLPDMDKVKPLDTRPSIVVLANDPEIWPKVGGKDLVFDLCLRAVIVKVLSVVVLPHGVLISSPSA